MYKFTDLGLIGNWTYSFSAVRQNNIVARVLAGVTLKSSALSPNSPLTHPLIILGARNKG